MKPWTEYTAAEKVAYLQSSRRDLVAQRRREAHTSRSSGIDKAIAKIDAQLRELAGA